MILDDKLLSEFDQDREILLVFMGKEILFRKLPYIGGLCLQNNGVIIRRGDALYYPLEPMFIKAGDILFIPPSQLENTSIPPEKGA